MPNMLAVVVPARSPEPGDGDERDLLCGWLAFHRDALAAKCDGVAGNDLVRSGLGGSTMSLLGLVRHLTEMERVYGVWALGGGHLEFLYGPYDDSGPDGDFDDLAPDMVESSLAAWGAERAAVDTLIVDTALDDIASGMGGRFGGTSSSSCRSMPAITDTPTSSGKPSTAPAASESRTGPGS